MLRLILQDTKGNVGVIINVSNVAYLIKTGDAQTKVMFNDGGSSLTINFSITEVAKLLDEKDPIPVNRLTYGETK